MIQFKSEDFTELLEKAEYPSTPYVAFGHYLKEYRDGERSIAPHVFILSMKSAHAQKEQLNYYVMQKRFRVLKWNLPANLKSQDGRTPYAELDALCQMYSQAGGVPDLLKKLKDAEEKATGLEAAMQEQKVRLDARSKKDS